MTIRRTSTLLMFVLITAVVAYTQQKACESCSVVDNALKAYGKLHSGMTRAELEEQFQPDGGLSFPPVQVYVFRDCSMIKVEIQFEKLNDFSDYNQADNKVKNFGRLFIDRMVMD